MNVPIFDNLKETVKSLSQLRIRVEYGVKEELLELVGLRGIGRVKARNLYIAGFKSLKDVREVTAEELSTVPALGQTLAEDIKRQTMPSMA